MADLPDLRATLGAAPIVRDVVRVAGPEAIDYLQGQLSQDVAALEVGGTARSLLLQPTGKVDAWLRVTRIDGEEVLLDVDQGHGDAVHARLRRFRLRTKVDLDLATWGGLAVRGPGARDVEPPPGTHALPAGWPGVAGVDLISEGEIALAGVELVPVAALEALRVEAGVPAMGAELTDATIPAEAGQWLIDGSVSFTKGCYTGQELVARVDSRGGNVPRPVRGVLLDADDVPTGGVLARAAQPDTAVGTLTSVAVSPTLGPVGLAVVARTVPEGERLLVRWDHGEAAATIAALPLR